MEIEIQHYRREQPEHADAHPALLGQNGIGDQKWQCNDTIRHRACGRDAKNARTKKRPVRAGISCCSR
ncbi:hypothetical protein D3C81_1218510 [compost metagenome]